MYCIALHELYLNNVVIIRRDVVTLHAILTLCSAASDEVVLLVTSYASLSNGSSRWVGNLLQRNIDIRNQNLININAMDGY